MFEILVASTILNLQILIIPILICSGLIYWSKRDEVNVGCMLILVAGLFVIAAIPLGLMGIPFILWGLAVTMVLYTAAIVRIDLGTNVNRGKGKIVDPRGKPGPTPPIDGPPRKRTLFPPK